MKNQFAEVLLNQKIPFEKATLTYRIPENMEITAGHGVHITLRKKKTRGIVMEVHNQTPTFKTEEILEKISDQPFLSEIQLKLMDFMHQYYFVPLNSLLKTFVPPKILNAKKKPETNIAEQKDETKLLKLTDEQKQAFEEIMNSNKNKFLIQGVTGSGKTELYVQIAKEYLKRKEQVLILVPEISLTPQMINYFEQALGFPAFVIHSKKTEKQKKTAYHSILENKAKLIIGSRSSIFAPFQSLKLIIMDEEHENSYKQESSPRYRTHKLIEKFQEFDPEIKIIYGSATPSIETLEILKDSTIQIKNRIGKTPLPDIETVDLRDEFKKKNYSIFSERLMEELQITLKNNDQAILFLNRRGSASSVVCRDCGHIETCKNCEQPLTFHTSTLQKEVLICHHCGKIETPPAVCPSCKGLHIRFLGIGTQKIENELKKLFPKIRILRADRDTTSTRDSFEEIYHSFKNHEADVLIGTQMISKGLHLPKVQLVGVVLADIGLNIPDFHTSENNFQLLTQVAGRAGRGKTQGKVLIQTYNPENINLQFIKNHDFDSFFTHERTQRKLLNNPPFSHLAKITVETPTLKESKGTAEKILKMLKNIASELKLDDQIESHTYPAYLIRLRNKYRYIVSLKDLSNTDLIHKLLNKLPKEYIISPKIKLDIDPISLT